jgi:hypothetical protein
LGKWLFRVLVALAILVPLAVVGFFVGMRHVGPTPAQQAALQLMTAPNPPVQGHDASDALWLLDYDVPVEKWPEVAAATRRYLDGKARGSVTGADPRVAFARYPEPPPDAPCQRRDDGCLAWVTEHRAEVGAMLDANKAGLDAARALAAYDGFRMGVPASLALDFPRLNSRRPLVLAEIAYRFASGERLSAVESVCRDIAGWRRIGGNADHLLVSMLGVHNVQADLKLFADMLAKMPKETELPEECGAALESSAPYEFELCPAVRYEYAAVKDVREAAKHAPPDEGGPPHWAIDWNNFEAMAAQAYAPYCEAAAAQAARADQRLLPPPLPSCGKWRRLADPYGCVLADIGGMSFNKFFDRRADQAQMLALARAVVWLRTAAEGPAEVESVLAQRPKDLGLVREPRYDAKQDRISIPLYDTRRETRFEVAAGAEPRPTRARHRAGSRRSRGLALAEQ